MIVPMIINQMTFWHIRCLRIVFVIFRLCTHQQRVELMCAKKGRGLMVGRRKGRTDDIQRKSPEEMR